MSQSAARLHLICLCMTLTSFTAAADQLLTVDASAQPPAPLLHTLRQGANRAPSGAVLGINSRYLTLDGRPWLPVMGEFHYARVPVMEWEEQLRKMQAAGVSIVSSYIIWQFHEQQPGRFDWTGDRDLRRFVTLCGKLGLYVFLRPGPWAHAEVRFGGVPDWVVNAMPTRGNDPAYLAEVAAFYRQIGAQVHGLLWKDGGPIIGAQVENEYNLTGPGQGRAHIAALKELLRQASIDVPLYTVTGWDNTIYPKGEVTPVFGGYADEPWDRSTTKLPPKSVYAFQFDSRVGRGLGAETAAPASGDADTDIARTPFLSAEYGGGVPVMYRRRPLIEPDDVAAMLPVQLGSGVNLYGYYMFQGGRNPAGDPSRQESTAIGGYNDLPMIGYDFGAPLGEYGKAHPVLAKLRPFHSFLQSWGSALAPMVPHRPAVLPSSPGDLATPRFAVRSLGDRGFLFVNNHIRQYAMQPQRNVQFAVRLPAGTLRMPSAPITIPPDAYFIWPINLDLGGATLAWATAQPLTRFDTLDGPVTVLHATAAIPVELALDAASIRSVSLDGHPAGTPDDQGHLVLRAVSPGTMLTITLKNGPRRQLLVLSETQAERSWVTRVAGQPRLLLTNAQVFAGPATLELRREGDPRFTLQVFPALPSAPAARPALSRQPNDGVFQTFTGTAAAAARCAVSTTALRPAGKVPPIVLGGAAQAAVEPVPPTFASAAAWTLSVSPGCLANLPDATLHIDYQGDVARLFSGVTLLDDTFYTGQPWEIGLKRFAPLLNRSLTLSILPLRADAPIYLEPGARPAMRGDDQVARVAGITVVPEYRLSLSTE